MIALKVTLYAELFVVLFKNQAKPLVSKSDGPLSLIFYLVLHSLSVCAAICCSRYTEPVGIGMHMESTSVDLTPRRLKAECKTAALIDWVVIAPVGNQLSD